MSIFRFHRVIFVTVVKSAKRKGQRQPRVERLTQQSLKLSVKSRVAYLQSIAARPTNEWISHILFRLPLRWWSARNCFKRTSTHSLNDRVILELCESLRKILSRGSVEMNMPVRQTGSGPKRSAEACHAGFCEDSVVDEMYASLGNSRWC
jgi:hypothetical protein